MIHMCVTFPLRSAFGRRSLKAFTFSAAFKSFGRLFHDLHPRYANARCPEDRRHRGMWSRFYDLVTPLWMRDRGTNMLARYSGTKLFTHLNTITASFKWSLSSTVSQLRDFMPWEMWSNFLSPNTIRAAKFCTSWSFFLFLWDALAHTVEQ